jgi:acetolactate synthase-1/2/3 large subunit
LAAGHSVPVITTYQGKGVLDEAHPAALGGAGLSPRADVELLRVVKAADLAILVGYDPIEMRPGWLNPFGPDATVVEITTAPVDHGMHRADLQIVGPPALALSALLNCPVEARWPQEEPQTARAALARLFAPPATWGPHAIVQVLQEEAPPDAVVTVDSGAHRILLSQMWKARLPLSLLQSAGWCTMGAAVPLAMGVAIARPGRPVAAVVGDGGLEMVAGELGTLRDRGLPVVVVVFQDASLALIELKQAAAGLARAGVGLGRTDLAGLAGAFGGRGVTVADAEGLRTALRDAFSAPTFTLVACAFDADQYAGAF